MANIVPAAGSGYGNPFIDSLIWGGGKWAGMPITYAFASGTYTSDPTDPWDPPGGFGASWGASEMAALQTALQLYSNVADIQFQQAASYADADLAWWKFSDSDLDGFLGLSQVPETPGGAQPIDAFFNYTDEMWADLTPGGLGFVVVLHELGHSLGLAHPHDGGSQPDWTTFPGVSDGRPSDLGTYSLNQGIWTTMSYNDGWNRVPVRGDTPSYGLQGTPMAFDIAALQELYGANLSYNTGDNSYLLPTSNGSGTFWSCIWDAGGDEDTIDANGATGACKINLNDATLAAGDPNAGGFVSWVQGIAGGFTIANDVVIENATGGAGRDTLTGNEFDNILTGNAGNDSLDGAAGADDMLGGLGDDRFNGGEGNDTLDGGLGKDVMAGGNGDDVYVVGETSDTVTESAATGGKDTVQSAITYTLGKNVEDLQLTAGDTKATGNTVDNLIIGSGGNNTLDGKTGADTMRGGLGDDLYIVDLLDEVDETGGAGKDTILVAASFSLETPTIVVSGVIENLTLAGTSAFSGTGTVGDNVITGNSGANVLDGKGGNDSLAGGSGNDSLVGDAGDDTLDGGVGNDTMIGSAGNDKYVVNSVKDMVDETGGGVDTVQATIAIDLTLSYDGIENVTLTGTAGLKATGDDEDNQLVGNDGANLLIGGVGLDTLIGGKGNDTLDGDSGADDADSLDGGLGNDTYLIDKLGDDVTEDENEGTDTVRTAVSGYVLTANVENLVLLAGAAVGTGNEVKNTLTGNDSPNTLDGKAGADTMAGGKSDDIYFVDETKDMVKEVSGKDSGVETVHSTAAAYTLASYVENLVLDGTGDIAGTGNTLNNVITGNTGNNMLNGGGGGDTMNAGAGNDTYVIDAKDAIADDGGFDIVQASFSIDLAAFADIEGVRLTGSGALSATGDGDANLLIGNAGANKLAGNGATDTIEGAAGNDTIDGGAGDDKITGGAGTDRINVADGNDTVFYASKLDGKDIIDSFDGDAAGGQDVLNLDLLFDSLGVADGDRAGRVMLVVNDAGTAVDVKVNTDANASFELTVATLNTSNTITLGVDVIISQP